MAWVRMTGGGSSSPSILNVLDKTPVNGWVVSQTLPTSPIANNNPLTWTNSSPSGDSIYQGRIETNVSYDISKYTSLILTASLAISTYYANAYPASIQFIAKGEVTGKEYTFKMINYSNNHNVQRQTIHEEYINIANLNLPTTEKYYIAIKINNWYTASTSQTQTVSKLTLIK